MTPHLGETVPCPHCGDPCDPDPDGEGIACPCCGWEFAADPDGTITDDGDLDPTGPFDLDAEGAPTNEPPAEVICPKCGRRLDAVEPGVHCCPGCRAGVGVVWSDRRHALVADVLERGDDGAPPDEYEEGDDYVEVEAEESVCPNGCIDGYGGPAPVIPIGNGWVVCADCGFDVYDPDLYREEVELQAELSGAGTAGQVVIRPGGHWHGLDEAFRRVRPGGMIVLRPGTYAAPRNPVPFSVTLAAGRRGSVVIDGEFGMVGGELRAAGLTFRGPVVLAHTRADFSRCEFADPLAASGQQSDVWVRGCRVRAGLVVENGAAARLIRSAVSGAAADGVAVTAGGWASLDRCRVAGNGRDGVVAGTACGVFLRRCLVAENAGAGVVVGGRAVLTRCRVAGNGGPNVAVRSGGRAVLRRCEVPDGPVVEPGARVRVRRPAGGADRPFVVA